MQPRTLSSVLKQMSVSIWKTELQTFQQNKNTIKLSFMSKEEANTQNVLYSVLDILVANG